MSSKLYPAFAGTWYPSSPNDLGSLLESYTKNLKGQVRADENLAGILAPHAGYTYSGNIAAIAHFELSLALGPKNLILLLAPSHYQPFRYAAIPKPGSTIVTPLGHLTIPSDLGILAKTALFEQQNSWIQKEHALEMHYPLLAYFLRQQPDTNKNIILPIMLGKNSYGDLLEVGRTLWQYIETWILDGYRFFFVASTDLSHFHNIADAEKMDSQIMPLLQSSIAIRNPRLVLEALQQGRVEACGGTAITLAMMIALQSYSEQKDLIWLELMRANSGVISGDLRRVVGYLAAALYLK